MQFLFDLPKKLKACVEENNYALVLIIYILIFYFHLLYVNIFFLQAVKYYAKSEQVLKDFGDHPSFSGIQSDCQEIVVTLRNRLKEQFNEAEVRRYVKEIIFLCLLTDSCPCLHLHR